MDCNEKCLICNGFVKYIGAFDGACSNLIGLYQFQLVECCKCGHVQKRLDERYLSTLKECYGQGYGHVGSKISEVNGKLFNRDIILAKTIVSSLNLADEGTLLDYGCGTGTLLNALGLELPKWCRVGFDLDAHNQGKIIEQGAKFIHGQIDEIQDQFDLILLIHCLEHITDPIIVLKKLSLLLRPGGHLVAIVPSFERVHTDLFFFEHCSHFTSSTLNLTLLSAGLNVIGTLREGLAPIEIGAIGKRPHNTLTNALTWSSKLPVRIIGHIEKYNLSSDTERIGLFGVGGAGLYLSQAVSPMFSFLVDDDLNKQGKLHAGKPIISVQMIPNGGTVFVAFNNPEASMQMKTRLQGRRPDVHFVDFPECD